MRVGVIGGGYAGLAAAVELARGGVAVELFESAEVLGGRARRVMLDGQALDNGQHLLLGAYRETLRLIELVAPGKSKSGLMRQRLHLESTDGFRLSAPRLPAPWHLAAALMFARGLTWRDRLNALRFARSLALRDGHSDRQTTVAQLLTQAPKSVTQRLWAPLCLAALNTPPEQASAQVFLHVLKAAFAQARADSDLLLPRIDLSALFPEPAAAFLAARGSQVHLAARVSELKLDTEAVRIDSGRQTTSCDAVICAVAPHQLRYLSGDLYDFPRLAAPLEAQGFQPIITAYAQCEAQLRLARPMLALDEAPGQWVIDRGQLGGPAGLLAVVVSAEGPHLAMPREELAAAIASQLRRQLPGHVAPGAVRIIHEKRATFCCRPGRAIPPVQLGERIFLAGDYCDPEFPGTIEAAVRSGVRAARTLLAAHARR